MLSWDDFRHVKAIADSGSLNGAAQALGINHSTAFRRLGQIEQRLGSRLFKRERSGYSLTPAGEEMMRLAERMEQDVASFARGKNGKPTHDPPATSGVVPAETVMSQTGLEFLRGDGRGPGAAGADGGDAQRHQAPAGAVRVVGGATIDAEDGPAGGRADVVVVNEQGSRPPVVFFHTWLTEAEHTRMLGEALGPDQPLYGIEPPADDLPPARAEDWAAAPLCWRSTTSGSPRPTGWRASPSAGSSPWRSPASCGPRAPRSSGSAWSTPCGRGATRVGCGPTCAYHLREVLDLPVVRRRPYVTKLVRGGARRRLNRTKITTFRVLRRLGLVEARPPNPDREPMTPLKRSVWKSYLNYEATTFDAPVAAVHRPRQPRLGVRRPEPAVVALPAGRLRGHADRGQAPRAVLAREHRVRVGRHPGEPGPGAGSGGRRP